MVFVMLLTYALPNITMATSMDTYLEESQAEILRSVKEQLIAQGMEHHYSIYEREIKKMFENEKTLTSGAYIYAPNGGAKYVDSEYAEVTYIYFTHSQSKNMIRNKRTTNTVVNGLLGYLSYYVPPVTLVAVINGTLNELNLNALQDYVDDGGQIMSMSYIDEYGQGASGVLLKWTDAPYIYVKVGELYNIK